MVPCGGRYALSSREHEIRETEEGGMLASSRSGVSGDSSQIIASWNRVLFFLAVLSVGS